MRIDIEKLIDFAEIHNFRKYLKQFGIETIFLSVALGSFTWLSWIFHELLRGIGEAIGQGVPAKETGLPLIIILLASVTIWLFFTGIWMLTAKHPRNLKILAVVSFVISITMVVVIFCGGLAKIGGMILPIIAVSLIYESITLLKSGHRFGKLDLSIEKDTDKVEQFRSIISSMRANPKSIRVWPHTRPFEGAWRVKLFDNAALFVAPREREILLEDKKNIHFEEEIGIVFGKTHKIALHIGSHSYRNVGIVAKELKQLQEWATN